MFLCCDFLWGPAPCVTLESLKSSRLLFDRYQRELLQQFLERMQLYKITIEVYRLTVYARNKYGVYMCSLFSLSLHLSIFVTSMVCICVPSSPFPFIYPFL